MGEDGVADIGDDALAEPHDEVEADGRTERQHGDDAEHDGEILVDQGGIGLGKAMVDDPADGDRHDQGGAGGDEKGKKGDDDPAPVAVEKGGEARQRPQIAALGPPAGLFFIGIAHRRAACLPGNHPV